MTSYRRFEDRGPRRAGDDSGAYEHSPLGRLADLLDEFEENKRRIVDAFRDVAAWGGTARTTGYSQSEWMALVGRLPGRDAWKFEVLVSRLPAMPVTAALLETGQLTVDQAVSIVAGTKRLSGDLLAEVEAEAAHVALSRNQRGDDPDMDADVDAIVQSHTRAADQDRRDRDRLDRNSVRIQPDIFGAGRITEDWADPEGFQTRVAALESAAGQPSPDVPRGQQLAEGSLATARAWLTGSNNDGDAAIDLRPAGARPTLVAKVDISDLDGRSGTVGQLASVGRLASTPWLGRQLTDTLSCNADLLVSIVEGERPLAEFRATKRLPERIRRQVLWRDMGCRWPGCRAPVAHADVHHLNEDPRDHRVDNLLTLCRRHHRRLHSPYWHPHLDGHSGRFELRRSPDGAAVHTTYPRGTRPSAQSPPEVAPAR